MDRVVTGKDSLGVCEHIDKSSGFVQGLCAKSVGTITCLMFHVEINV